MPWLRIDDRVRTHPKIVAAGPAAAWFWFCGIAYCREHLTDGFIPTGMLASLAPGVTTGKTHALKLVLVGLWHPTDGGFTVHDFLDWNPSRADVTAGREADKERKRKDFQPENERKKTGIQPEPSRDRAGALARARVNGSGSDLSMIEEQKDLQADPLLAQFARFWAAYPKKTGKGAAWRIWTRLRPDDELVDRMLAAVAWQRTQAQWAKDGGQYVPNPATWLHQNRWTDEPIETSERTSDGASTAEREQVRSLMRAGMSADVANRLVLKS